jgi:hypothetical protein
LYIDRDLWTGKSFRRSGAKFDWYIAQMYLMRSLWPSPPIA